MFRISSVPLLQPGEPLTRTMQWRLYLVAFLSSLAAAIPWPLSVLLSDALGVSGVVQGVLFALPGLGQLATAQATGRWMSRRGKKAALLALTALMAAAWLVVAVHLSYATVAAAQLVSGVFTGSLAVLGGYVGAHTSARTRSNAFARMLSARGVGQVLGAVVAAALADAGARWACLAVVATCGAALLAAQSLCESREDGSPVHCGWAMPRLPAGAGMALVAMALLWVTPSMLSQYVPMHARDAMGVSSQTMSLLFSFLGLTMVTAPLMLRALEPALEHRAALGVFAAMTACVCALAFSGTLGALLLAFLAWALFWDTAYPYVKGNLSRRVGPGEQASIQAAEQWVVGFVQLVTPPAAGLLYVQRGAESVFALAGMLSVLGVAAFAASLRRARVRTD